LRSSAIIAKIPMMSIAPATIEKRPKTRKIDESEALALVAALTAFWSVG
jgi:hypothetical protein